MGFYKLKTGPSYKLKTGPSFYLLFSPSFIVCLGIFRNTDSVTVCQNSVFANFWVIKNEVFEKKIAFFLFYVGEIDTKKEKMKMEKTKKTYKNRVFKVVIQKCEQLKKVGFLPKIAWHYLCQEGRRKTRIFVHTICFGQNLSWTKTVQSRKYNKNRGFSGNCKKQNDTFFGKGCFFDMVEKVGSTNCVFEKLCFLKTLSLECFQRSTVFQKQKLYVEKKQKIHEK